MARWTKAVMWVGGALVFRHVILALDDDDQRVTVVNQYDSCKGHCDD